jgi:hypothetical protein
MSLGAEAIVLSQGPCVWYRQRCVCGGGCTVGMLCTHARAAWVCFSHVLLMVCCVTLVHHTSVGLLGDYQSSKGPTPSMLTDLSERTPPPTFLSARQVFPQSMHTSACISNQSCCMLRACQRLQGTAWQRCLTQHAYTLSAAVWHRVAVPASGLTE